MASIDMLVRRWPRTAAAVGFGVAGVALTALWFLPSVFGRGDGVGFLLYIAAPGAAAALAGALAGPSLCDPARTRSVWQAVLRGAVVATLAVLIFAPVFAILFSWTEPGRMSVLGLTVLVLKFSFIAVWWVVAAVGGGIGWMLYHLASRRAAA